MNFSSCRLCGADLRQTLVDLGLSPLANSYVTAEQLRSGETFYPLRVMVCERCLLVQLEDSASPEKMFATYSYLSSYSRTWTEHVEAYAASMSARFSLGAGSKVVEIASNDGCLLECFLRRGIAVLGVEPAGNVAQVAIERGVPTEAAFFGEQTAERLRALGHAADLIPANNVLAHAPDMPDFLGGFALLLKPDGVATFEFPHLMRLMEETQFDTIYHEHVYYLSLSVVADALRRCGLRAFDVERLATHGGSLRVFACHAGASHAERPSVQEMLSEEKANGLLTLDRYAAFGEQVTKIKCDATRFLVEARQSGKMVCAYGAAAKGNTFINSCGLGPDLIPLVADLSPYKQGRWLPGSRIPVVSPDTLIARKPDFVLILPWNLSSEIAEQLAGIRAWGGRFVTAIPELRIF